MLACVFWGFGEWWLKVRGQKAGQMTKSVSSATICTKYVEKL